MNNDELLVSVVMSVFSEPESFIRMSIESILAQTFDNFEFIIINDNPESKLNHELLLEYKYKDSRIIIVENQINLGLACSLNIGLKMAKGMFIARMDADDVSLPNRLAIQVDFLRKNPFYGVCGTFVKTIDVCNKLKKKVLLYSSDQDIKAYLLFASPFVHPTIMFRAELIKNYLYNEEFKRCQDYELWVRLSMVTYFYNIPTCLLYYRVYYDFKIKRNYAAIAGPLENKIKEMALKIYNINESDKNKLILFMNKDINICMKELNIWIIPFLNKMALINDSFLKVIIRKYISLLISKRKFLSIFVNPIVKINICFYYKILFGFIFGKC